MKSTNKLALSASASLIAVYLLLNLCSAETHDVLCKAGNTRFKAYFHTGIDVIVGPVGKGGLATRSCEATLSGKEDVVVASDVAEIDLDMSIRRTLRFRVEARSVLVGSDHLN